MSIHLKSGSFFHADSNIPVKSDKPEAVESQKLPYWARHARAHAHLDTSDFEYELTFYVHMYMCTYKNASVYPIKRQY